MAALHDVSKHDDQRLDPKANASDARAQRDATNTTSIHPVTDATTTKGFLKTGSGQVLGNDGSNNIGLFGFDSTGSMVVKVAKPGFDADTAANSNLIFNSSQNTFKIVATGTLTIPGFTFNTGGAVYATSSQSITVAHGLSFVPGIIAFIGDGTSFTMFPFMNFQSVTTTSWAIQWINVTVDATNINGFSYALGLNENIPITARTVKYYLLQETAS